MRCWYLLVYRNRWETGIAVTQLGPFQDASECNDAKDAITAALKDGGESIPVMIPYQGWSAY